MAQTLERARTTPNLTSSLWTWSMADRAGSGSAIWASNSSGTGTCSFRRDHRCTLAMACDHQLVEVVGLDANHDRRRWPFVRTRYGVRMTSDGHTLEGPDVSIPLLGVGTD